MQEPPQVTRRSALTQTLAAVALAALPATTRAAEKPPLRVIVGFSAGGNVDWVARVLSEKLRGPLGRTLIVDNKPGAGSRLALNELRRQPADGSVIALSVDAPFTMYPYTVAKLEFDTVKDFSPILRLVTFDYAIAVAASHPAKNLREFVAWAAKNPKEAALASPGAGSGPAFVGEMIAKTYKIKLTDVPYRGGSAANNDVLGGQIAGTTGTLPDMLDLHRAGKLRVIAVGGAKRSTLLPDVPTLRESGIDFDSEISISIYGPKALPAAFITSLSQAASDALAQPELRAQFISHGLTPALAPAAQLAELQQKEAHKWEAVIKASGFVPQ